MLSRERLERLERLAAEAALAGLEAARAMQPHADGRQGEEADADRRIFLRALRDVLADKGEALDEPAAQALAGDTPEREADDEALLRRWCETHRSDYAQVVATRHERVRQHLRWSAAVNDVLRRLPAPEAQRVVADFMDGTRHSPFTDRVRALARTGGGAP